MLSRTVLKHQYKTEGDTIASPSMQIVSQSTWDRIGVSKKFWQSLTREQKTEMNIQYYDRLDGGES